jgi:hypothetical protein
VQHTPEEAKQLPTCDVEQHPANGGERKASQDAAAAVAGGDVGHLHSRLRVAGGQQGGGGAQQGGGHHRILQEAPI